jgi:hypothetical protein
MRLSNLKWVLGAVAVVAAVLVLRSFLSARDAEWQARVETEMVRAELALGEADSFAYQAALQEARADSAFALAEERDTVIIRMVEELPAPPVDCEPFTAPRDSVIMVMEERHNDIRTAFEKEREAAALLRQAEAAAHRAADSLMAVLDDRPRPVSPLIPEIGVGVFAGMCSTGQPCAGIGVGVQWKVRLF